VIRRNPTLPDGFRKRAAIHALKGDFSNAIQDIEEAMSIAPGQPEYYFFRGWWNLELGNFESTLDDMSRAIELGQSENLHFFDESAYFFRAVSFLQLGKFPEALSESAKVRDDFVIHLQGPGELSKQWVIYEATKRSP
jgi:tetratricopeptide (TPR) repeat protein